mgnify:CR=1 FL=1
MVVAVGDMEEITINGQTPTLLISGFSFYTKPGNQLVSPSNGELLTGEPCAGEPHARFGGRGTRESTGSSYPYWINKPEKSDDDGERIIHYMNEAGASFSLTHFVYLGEYNGD